MNDTDEKNTTAALYDLLKKAGMVNGDRQAHGLRIESLNGDGSSRKFWRITLGKEPLCLAVAPPSYSERDLAEARAARSIGLHLLQQEVSVPAQYGWDEEHGILLFEDLGDQKLHDYTLEMQGRGDEDFIAAVRPWYQQVIAGLVGMQVKGAVSFDPSWCWDSPRYDRTLMLERESGYFLRAFWQELLGNQEPDGIQDEFIELAGRAAGIASTYFLHRDFQSRNIMIHGDEVCFIDFQGGVRDPWAMIWPRCS